MKHYAVVALVCVVVIAIVWRVAAIKQIVVGA
jgi:hypothetical protein